MQMPLSMETATAYTVACDNIMSYVIFHFHEEVSICRFHELRHSHASMLIDMGFDALEISERLGHESVKTTLDTYSHLYPDKDKKLAGALNKLRRPEISDDQSFDNP